MRALWTLLLFLGQASPAPAPDEGRLPASVEALFQEKEKDGKPSSATPSGRISRSCLRTPASSSGRTSMR